MPGGVPKLNKAVAKKVTKAVAKALTPKMSSWDYGFASIRELEYRELEQSLTIRNDPKGQIRASLRGYYQQGNFEDQILRVYTRSNKAIGKAEGLTPVKIGHGQYGWITEGGYLIRQADIGYALKSVDYALGDDTRQQLFNAYKNATPKQRAQIASALQDFDWDTFWKIKYKHEEGTIEEGSMDDIFAAMYQYIPDFEYKSTDVEMSEDELWERMGQ